MSDTLEDCEQRIYDSHDCCSCDLNSIINNIYAQWKVHGVPLPTTPQCPHTKIKNVDFGSNTLMEAATFAEWLQMILIFDWFSRTNHSKIHTLITQFPESVHDVEKFQQDCYLVVQNVPYHNLYDS